MLTTKIDYRNSVKEVNDMIKHIYPDRTERETKSH